MLRHVLVLLGCGMLAVAGPLPGVELELLPPAPGDLTPAVLQSAALPPPEVAREDLDFSWWLDPASAVEAPAPATLRSRQYWFATDAAELHAGVPLALTAPGAVVRVNPLEPVSGDDLVAVQPAALELVRPDGSVIATERALAELATPEQLARSGLPFPAGTTAFRLRADLDAEPLTLRAPRLEPSATRFMVHVLEPASSTMLAARAAADVVHAGSPVRAEARLQTERGDGRLEAVEAELLAPDGRILPAAVELTDGSAVVRAVPDGETSEGGLWELQLRVSGATPAGVARRDLRVPFAVALPTGRLTGTAAVEQHDGLRFGLGVELAAAGRYELRGVLYGTDAAGVLRPLAAGHTAGWREAGFAELVLRFEAQLLASSALGPPYELRHLALHDQGRVGVLQRQERALVVAVAGAAGAAGAVAR